MSSLPPLMLALDASTTAGTVAVGRGGSVLAEITVDVRAAHSTALLPAADQVVRAVGGKPEELGAVVVGGGPGSFTGLRIAAATAKGIAHARGLTLCSYSSLMAAAAQCWAAYGPVCALIDARGRDVYAAVYRFRPAIEVLLPPEASTLDQVLARFQGSPPLFTGDGALRHRAELESELGACVADQPFTHPRAATLLWLAEQVPDLGRVRDPAAWEPEYLRASGAERIAAARAANRSTA
jgi:tRNA threonylcarbamoyladenosine biosynthesis protein TsaB